MQKLLFLLLLVVWETHSWVRAGTRTLSPSVETIASFSDSPYQMISDILWTDYELGYSLPPPLSCSYNHFNSSGCQMFRPEDYLPPQEQGRGREVVEAPNDEQLLQDVLMSECPRCGQVGRCKLTNMPMCSLAPSLVSRAF